MSFEESDRLPGINRNDLAATSMESKMNTEKSKNNGLLSL